jgi:Beta protein
MLPYRPALRFKQGEYLAAAKIPRDIQKHIEPYFIIPPPKERDPEKGRPLTLDEIAYQTGERIGKHWPLYRAYLDPQYVLLALRDAGVQQMFRIAQARNPMLVPVVTVSQLGNPLWRQFLRPVAPRLAINLPYEQIDPVALVEGLKAIGCRAEDVDIFIDFTGAPFDLEDIASSVAGILDSVAEIAPWRSITFQGSAYPTKNPAEEGKDFLVPRREWSVFLQAMAECSVAPERIGFSDFGADCGEINFPKKSGGKPIPHSRYTSAKSTFVVRGASTGKHAVTMTDVFTRLIGSEHFSGQGFSYADRRMWEAAKGHASCGNPSMWREWNMAHHMVRVVRDLGAMVGITFADGPVTTISEQGVLFEVK